MADVADEVDHRRVVVVAASIEEVTVEEAEEAMVAVVDLIVVLVVRLHPVVDTVVDIAEEAEEAMPHTRGHECSSHM